jgi:hypothetical protein
LRLAPHLLAAGMEDITDAAARMRDILASRRW